LPTVETPHGALSGVICGDADFPAVSAQTGRNGTDILLSPAIGWQAIGPLHGQMPCFRAVENGITGVRRANHGLALASMEHFTSSDRDLRAAAPTSGA